MATSPQDQPTPAKTVQNQAYTSKRWLRLRLLITFVALILVAAVILMLLIYFKILSPQWFVPLLTTLGPIFGTLGAFVNATLSDKDFQQSFRRWLTKHLFGDTEEKKDGKDPDPPPAPQPANPPSSSEPIFFANMKLTNRREFYGRAIERAQLLNRTRHGGCTSIVGPRRSGKTWLMTYLRLVAADELGTNFRIGYMSAALPSSATRAGFIREALKVLDYPPYSLPECPDLTLLEHFVRDVVTQNNTPILCIDEFEGLTHHPTEFDLQFFEGLRAITEVGPGLVVLSKEPLIDIVSESTRTSPFFNVFLQLSLVPFDREDAEQFVQEKGAQAQFTEQERAYLLAYGQTEREQFPPLRLQLVGEMLLNEKRAAFSAGEYHYRPNDPEYWQAFKERVDAEYRGMVKS